MLVFYLRKYTCGAYSKQHPLSIPGFLPLLGETCIPERYDEAFGPRLPVLTPGGGGRGVLRTVAAAQAFGLALPGSSHTSRAPEAGPRAHPRHACLHPLRSLLTSASSESAEEGGEGKPKGFCVTVPPTQPQNAAYHRSLTPKNNKSLDSRVLSGALLSFRNLSNTGCIFPCARPLPYPMHFVYPRYLVSCKCIIGQKKYIYADIIL